MSYQEDYEVVARHKLQTKRFKLEKIDLDIQRLTVERKKVAADIQRMEEMIVGSSYDRFYPKTQSSHAIRKRDSSNQVNE